jgi:hypothetical protein
MLELNSFVRKRAHRVLVVLGLAVAPFVIGVPMARADIMIAGDIEALAPIELSDVATAPGFGIRVGWQLHLPLIALTPEIGYKWANFARGATINRGIIGARVSIGEIFRFGAAAHLGFGHRSEDYQAEEHSNTGMSLDAGLFFDITVLPLLDLGVHIDYGQISGDESKGMELLQWVAFGAHVALIL